MPYIRGNFLPHVWLTYTSPVQFSTVNLVSGEDVEQCCHGNTQGLSVYKRNKRQWWKASEISNYHLKYHHHTTHTHRATCVFENPAQMKEGIAQHSLILPGLFYLPLLYKTTEEEGRTWNNPALLEGLCVNKLCGKEVELILTQFWFLAQQVCGEKEGRA